MTRTASRVSIACALAGALLWASTLRSGEQRARPTDRAQPELASGQRAASDPRRGTSTQRGPSAVSAVADEEEYVEPYGEQVSEQEQRGLQRIAQSSNARLAELEGRWRAESSSRTGEAKELGEDVLQALREHAPTAAGSVQMECRSTLCRFHVPIGAASSLMAPMHAATSERAARFTVLRQGGAELSALEVVMDVASDDFSGLGGI